MGAHACFTSLSRNKSSAGTLGGLCRERSLRAYDGVVNVVGNPKSSHFKRSQALANQVVKKGVFRSAVLCGLSPAVLAGWSLVHRYTFWNGLECFSRSVSPTHLDDTLKAARRHGCKRPAKGVAYNATPAAAAAQTFFILASMVNAPRHDELEKYQRAG